MLGIDIQSAGYESKIVIRRLLFDIKMPTLLAVLGHNGSGKTTLFRCLTGSISFEGNISWEGKPIAALKNQPVAFLPQQNILHFSITVIELIRLGLYPEKNRWFGYSEEENKTAGNLAVAFGLGEKITDEMSQLSGGQQQLAWLAQLAARNAPVWILDEPTQGLDLYHKHLMMKYLVKQLQEEHRTIIFSTHDLDLLEGANGYLLNLSTSKPMLEKITSDSLAAARTFLSKAPNISV